ncbi:SusC/RagA family TonB-linked outer membrane protein [Odoribacter sp. AF15-53]|uniref:SusC/RagA family TonB-linked outer membrane protein n=3 Tax=Odoribacteraceae TaxID=1853231 RepID=UPI001F3705DA|nr:SusC/RagA family TonB-linked outer membrane protein [Odoribacter sp. AF15-53]
MKKTYDRKFFRQKLLSERKTVTTVSRLLIVLLLGFPFFTRAGTSDVPRVGGFFPGILVRQDTVTRGEKPGNQKQEVYMGEVMDTEGNPLPGVTVLLKGTRMGTSTDMNGEFRFQAAKEGKAVLVFSFIGMKPVEKEMTPGKKVLVRMEEEVKGIEEVVVNGIYSRDKNSYTGSATTYSAKELKMIGAQNLIQSLKTLDPSMLVVESKQWGSDPNRMPKIEIRGKTSVVGLKTEFENDPNQPLFILDGVESTLETIINLNMDRVANVTILKDAASTAIYGSKAANGVIVVETKSPESGQLRLSYSGNYGVSFADLSDYNLMNASEKLEFELLAGRYSPIEGYEGFVDKLQKMQDYYIRLKEVLRGVDTYWLGEPLRTVFNHSHNLYIDGGDKAMRYGLGISYNNRDGVMKKSDRDGLGVNIDLIYRKKGLLFSNKASLDVTNSKREPVAFSEFSRANPYYRKKQENGTIPMYLERRTGLYGEDMLNPLYVWNIENTNETKDLALRDNFTMEWTTLDALRLRARLGISKSISKTEAFKSPNHTDFLETEKLKKGSFSSSQNESFSYNGDLNVIFGKIFNNIHQVNFVGGWSFSESRSETSGYSVVGFNDDFHKNPAYSTGFRENQKPTYSKDRKRSTSFFMNLNYSYNNRYLMDFNLRADGTSVFGSNKLFSTTWAIGLAWNIHNEGFIQKLGWVNNLKIRGSIGNPGNENFDAYISQKTYVYNVELQNMFGASALIEKYGNKDLEWQRTVDKNIGVDLSIIDNRIRVSFDYYFKDTDPLLVSISMPPSAAATSLYTNLGRQISRGWTATLNYVFLRKQDLSCSVNMNARANHSEYRDIGDKLDYLNEVGSSTVLNRYYEGGSPDDLWAVPSLGIDPATGREVFLKKDGTQTFLYSASDEVIVGSSVPDVEGIVGMSFYYKKLSASFNFRYRLGGETKASALYEKVENISQDNIARNQDKRALHDRWKKPGEKSKFKAIDDYSSTPLSSRFVVTENTFSGESISIGYDMDALWLQGAGIEGMNFRVYMNDIFRISSFKEERGLDYPFARSVSFSLGVRF